MDNILLRKKLVVVDALKKQIAVMAQKADGNRQAIYMQVPPEVLLGFRVGTHLDFAPYDLLGMRHPKAENGATYYKLGSKHKEAPKFAAICSGIERNMCIDTPVLIWIYEDDKGGVELVVLDGASRVSSIGYIRSKYPSSFRLIPIHLFEGTRDAAIVEMTRRNLPGRARDLTPEEAFHQVIFHHKADMPLRKIAEMLGFNESTGAEQASMIVQLDGKAGRKVLQAYFKRRITLRTAVEISRRPEMEQEAMLKEIESERGINEGISLGDVKEKTNQKKEVDVRSLRMQFQRARASMVRAWDGVASITEHEGKLVAKWKELEGMLSQFDTQLCKFEGKILTSQASAAAAAKDSVANLEHLTGQHLIQYTFDDWREQFAPVPRKDNIKIHGIDTIEKSLNESVVPLKPFLLDDRDSLPENNKVWSLLEDDHGYYLLAGRVDIALFYVVCENAFEEDISRREARLENTGIIEANKIRIRTEEEIGKTLKTTRQKPEWKAPESSAFVVKDAILEPWYNSNASANARPHDPDAILEVIDADAEGKKALDLLLQTDKPRERKRRFKAMLDQWITEKLYNTYQVLAISKEGKGTRYAVRRSGSK